MKLKSINQLVTAECNARCNMCFAWKRKTSKVNMSSKDFFNLYATESLSAVEEVTISGGEPTLREDLKEVMEAILSANPNISTVFVNSNCSFPERVMDFAQYCREHVGKVYIVVSLDGDRLTHDYIRGIETYDKVLYVLSAINAEGHEKVKCIISTTMQKANCCENVYRHISGIANEYRAGITFRPAQQSSMLYGNEGASSFEITPEQQNLLIRWCGELKSQDLFMREQWKHLRGERTIMEAKDGTFQCLAGVISVVITADGDLYPCIYSEQRIGDKNHGILDEAQYLQAKMQSASCPCCTECQIYPMLNFAGIQEKAY